MAEILVVLHRGETPRAARAWGQAVHVVSDRVLTLELRSGASLADLGAESAVRWAGARPPHEVLDELNTDERLFVKGWLGRRMDKPVRPGEGLDWDAVGRLPPDPPVPPKNRPNG